VQCGGLGYMQVLSSLRHPLRHREQYSGHTARVTGNHRQFEVLVNLTQATIQRLAKLINRFAPADFLEGRVVSINRFRRAMMLLLCVTALPWAAYATAAQLHFYTEELPPINFSRGGKATGLATEIVEEIMRRTGMQAPIEVIPWPRAYKYATSGPNVVLFSTAYTPEREKLFKWVGPIALTTSYIYRKRGGMRIENIEQARKAERILVYRESYLEQMLRGLGFSNLYIVTSPVEAMRMLVAGRAPLMAYEDIPFAATAEVEGLNISDIEPAFILRQSFLYIAFSRDTPDDVVARWQKALDAMKADGTFEQLYAKWLPGMKPPGVKPPGAR
jgi:polar amino acid transport system substrate-binding protein